MASESSSPKRGVRTSGEERVSLSARALRAWSEFADEPRPNLIPPENAEVDAALEEFGGDFRATIRALLHDLAVLAGDFAAVVSRGYVRGGVSEGGRRVAGGRRTGTGE